MSRSFEVFGEYLVKIRFGLHLSGVFTFSGSNYTELGLATDSITLIPRFVHRDIKVDDFGTDIPAEVLWMMADFNIKMSLIHFDIDVLELCMMESMGGGFVPPILDGGANPIENIGDLYPAGTIMGGKQYTNLPNLNIVVPQDISGCHYMGLWLMSTNPVNALTDWFFNSTYLLAPPLQIPIGTKATIAQLLWRAIPTMNVNASGQVFSSGTNLFRHQMPTTGRS